MFIRRFAVVFGTSVIVILVTITWLLFSSSSSDANEFRSEFDGDGDCCEKLSCSCIIVRNSWIDSFNTHSCDSSDRSIWRRLFCNRNNKIKRKKKLTFLCVTKYYWVRSHIIHNLNISFNYAGIEKKNKKETVRPSQNKFITTAYAWECLLLNGQKCLCFTPFTSSFFYFFHQTIHYTLRLSEK